MNRQAKTLLLSNLFQTIQLWQFLQFLFNCSIKILLKSTVFWSETEPFSEKKTFLVLEKNMRFNLNWNRRNCISEQKLFITFFYSSITGPKNYLWLTGSVCESKHTTSFYTHTPTQTHARTHTNTHTHTHTHTRTHNEFNCTKKCIQKYFSLPDKLLKLS